MTRDGLPRAYLRLDPNIDQTHPDLDAFVRLMCAAARQPERGRFKDRAVLERAVGRAKVTKAIARGDVVTLPDGRLYLQGWDEWQEGDWTVAERMRRMRDRRKAHRVAGVTPPASPRRNDVTTDAGIESSYLEKGGVRVDDSPPPPAGRRKNGTNPRALGTNPRANGTSPRQEREAQKRGPSSLHQILTAVAKGEKA